MKLTHIVSLGFALAIGASNVLGTPLPNAAVKRDAITSALTSLEDEISSVLGEITNLGQSGGASADNLAPLIEQIISEITSTTAAIDSASSGSGIGDLVPTAGTLTTIITNIATSLQTVPTSVISATPNTSGLGSALGNLQDEVNDIVPGVTAELASALDPISSILDSLGLGDLLSVLGLLTGILGIL
ncbi:hypothetical protein GLOTRDRAFT_140299 [Gloeophyllum trabeum ATCC 11539]|uniref:Uncharacterized protein n=1 Tax=Gloeophyllum trabeum (strain ATCC 11539 / FP-39264 / Madison 617) TaxID=670483 RepID=S7PZ97_GLOTA|nr:uncharacterized protein GLOTRDRAFT_140299 [Gloeophyllum trabeum ATCC 11539]EPQ52612.1 hypothetical protein GLOTRDRAFT_140299 [Gloeophyllum trabeum ATCC 11539]